MDATPVTLHLTADEAVYVELCLARRRELLALSDTAHDGQVLARCENATVDLARRYGHELLTAALARRVAGAEKKGPRPAPVGAGGCGRAAARMSGRS